jgi:prepilin-type N-terminal cleavage/methylation domain-containing protein
MKEFKKQTNKGFTLVELMVASSVFAVIMVVSVGALIVTLNTAKRAKALRMTMDNVNFAMESMSKSLRMGTNYTCVSSGTIDVSSDPLPRDCNNGSFISFIPQNKDHTYRVGYQLINGILNRYDNSSIPVPIISNDVKLDTLNFTVKGSDPNDGRQASVYIIMKGTIMVKGVPNSFAIQTMASQRNF